MSVRRRAIRERVEREGMRRADFERTKASLERMRAMCERKIAAGETNITTEELNACFPETVSPEQT